MRFKIDWASLIVGRKFTVAALYLRAISKYKHPEGFYLEGFLRYEYGGLYLEGLIHGGAYFRNLRYDTKQIKQPQMSKLKGPWFSLAHFPNRFSNVHDMRYYERRALFATDET